MVASSLNAKSVIKMDIVKPIPPKKPTATISSQDRLSGFLIILNLLAMYVKPTIPSGLPMMSPHITPKTIIKCCETPPKSIATPAFENANKGIIKKALNPCS